MVPTVFDRVLEYGDAWMPNPVGRPADELAGRITELGRRAAELGRPTPPMAIFGAPEDRGQVQRYAELGVERCLFLLPALPSGEALRRLDGMAELVTGHEMPVES